MIKRISKIGTYRGLIFDAALRKLTGLQAGDEVNVMARDGTIVIVPVRSAVSAGGARKVARKLIRRNSALFKRLRGR